MSRPQPPARSKKGRKTARQRNTDLSNNNAEDDDTLLGVDLAAFDSRAQFPEGGVDIVPRSTLGHEEEQLEDDDPTGILVSQISEWQQNFLFKRRKQLFRRRNLMAEAVPMLVPNPNDDGIEPQIGDDKISDLSDLSDHVNDDDENSDLVSSEEESDLEIDGEATNNRIDEIDEVPTTAAKIETVQNVSQAQTNAERRLSSSSVSSKDSGFTRAFSTNQLEKSPINKSVAPRQKKTEKPVNAIKFLRKPQDLQVQQGTTARLSCIVNEDSPEFSKSS